MKAVYGKQNISGDNNPNQRIEAILNWILDITLETCKFQEREQSIVTLK